MVSTNLCIVFVTAVAINALNQLIVLIIRNHGIRHREAEFGLHFTVTRNSEDISETFSQRSIRGYHFPTTACLRSGTFIAVVVLQQEVRS